MHIDPALRMRSMSPRSSSGRKTGQVCKKMLPNHAWHLSSWGTPDNTDLYLMADEHSISEMIRERQLQFTWHCLACQRMNQANIYVIYQSKIRRSNRCRNPGLTYLDQISKYLSTDKTVRFSAEEIANYAKDKQLWNLSIAMHKLPARWWWW